MAGSVSIRFGCLLVAAGLSLQAQYTADTSNGGRGLFGPLTTAATRPVGEMEMMTRSPAPDVPRPTTPAGLDATVSLHRLQHKVPGSEVKE